MCPHSLQVSLALAAASLSKGCNCLCCHVVSYTRELICIKTYPTVPFLPPVVLKNPTNQPTHHIKG